MLYMYVFYVYAVLQASTLEKIENGANGLVRRSHWGPDAGRQRQQRQPAWALVVSSHGCDLHRLMLVVHPTNRKWVITLVIFMG